MVFYRIIRGSTAQTNKHDTFYLQQRPDNGETWADIKVNHPLDYENIKEYNLTVRVEVGTRNAVGTTVRAKVWVTALWAPLSESRSGYLQCGATIVVFVQLR